MATKAKAANDPLAGLVPRYEDLKAKPRVANPLIPVNPLLIHDFPADYMYHWVHRSDTHNLADHLQEGWNYYPAEQLANRPGQGKPWMVDFENKDGRVLFADQWLLVADRRWNKEGRQSNVDKRNQKRQNAKQPGKKFSDRGTPYTVEYSTHKEDVVKELLAEMDSDSDSLFGKDED